LNKATAFAEMSRESVKKRCNFSHLYKGRVCTCCSASHMSQTCDEKCFTISQVAADWHELMIPQRTMRGHPLPASANNWTRGLQLADIPPPQSATLACKLLLISRPAEGRRLS